VVQIGREMLDILDELEEVRRQEGIRRHGDRLPPPRPDRPRKGR
jgi:hypothetical protein